MIRMLLNLKHVYVRMCSFPQARDVMELLLAVDPSAINELRDRGLLSYQLKDFSGALRDLQRYLHLSAGPRRSGNPGRTGADLGARQDAAEASRGAQLSNLPFTICNPTWHASSTGQTVQCGSASVQVVAP